VYQRVPPATLKLHLAEWLAEQKHVSTQAALQELDRVDAEVNGEAEIEGDERSEGMMATVPPWMTRVEHLVAHPELLAGTLTLASSDEIKGRAAIGRQNLDERESTDLVDENTVPVHARQGLFDSRTE
jgi:hypothetical protein